MSTPVGSYTTNIYTSLPPIGAQYHNDYIQNWKLLDFIIGNKNNYVVDGLAVSAGTGLNINWAAGTANVEGVDYAIVAGNGLIADNTADPNLYLANFVYVNSTGVVTINTDLPAAGYAILAIVFANNNNIVKLIDFRKTQGTGGGGGGSSLFELDGNGDIMPI